MNIPKMTDEQIYTVWHLQMPWLNMPPFSQGILDYTRAALAARDAQWQAALAEQEPVAQIVSSGPHDFPLLEWLSADHSFRAPIGSMLYAAPTNPAAQERAEPVAPAAQGREQFETWLRARWTDGYACPRKANGDYEDIGAQTAWEAWRDSRATISATPPAPAQPDHEHADLMKFYGVDNLSSLAEAQHQHIEKLQAKLPRNDQPAFTRVREG